MEINNKMYDTLARDWWNDNCGSSATIRYFVQPARFAYFMEVLGKSTGSGYFSDLSEELSTVRLTGKTLLDVGCGGGFLSEEFAKAGIAVTAIDPSEELIEVAKEHAALSNLDIKYLTGNGENLPFENGSFDFVACCDVLEHVDDLEKVISQVARVLKTGGMFFYDTINRTLAGKMLINVTQKWKKTSFTEPDAHLWEKFIKPKELFSIMKRYNLGNKEIKGITPQGNMIAGYLNFRRCKKGLISFKELGRRLNFRISPHTSGSYIGYAVKGAWNE